MFQPGSIELNAALLLTGLALVVFAWRSVSALPWLARWSLRLVLLAVIIVPFALIALAPQMQRARAPSQPQIAERRLDGAADRDQATAPQPARKKKAAKPKSSEAEESKLDDEVAKSTDANAPPRPVAPASPPPPPSAPATAPAPVPPPMAAPQPAPGASSVQPDAAARPDPVGGSGLVPGEGRGSGAAGSSTRGLGTSGTGTGGGGTGIGADSHPRAANGADSHSRTANGAAPAEPDRSAASSAPPPAAATAGAESEDWMVVPVYYGTDRARLPNDKRIDYGYDRGRRLELGRAMVSVPKAHEVPQIERPWAITIPYFRVKIYEEKEDPKKHFTMQELKTLSEAELLALVKERLTKSARYKDHAFVFVHGYNTSFDYAVFRAAQIAYDIKFDGAPFVYSWPSGGGIASYTYDRESASQAENYLADFLKLVTQKSGAKHVSVIAHSMGNQLLLRVLQDLQRTKPDGVEISQIIFAAPDVDRDAFEAIAGQLKDFARGGITLYTAANDRALEVSRRFHGGVPRAGDVPVSGPLVMPGIDTIDATAVSMDSLGLHHSGYAESNALLQDIGLLIQTGERPPGKRVPILQEVKTDKGAYWRYPAGP